MISYIVNFVNLNHFFKTIVIIILMPTKTQKIIPNQSFMQNANSNHEIISESSFQLMDPKVISQHKNYPNHEIYLHTNKNKRKLSQFNQIHTSIPKNLSNENNIMGRSFMHPWALTLKSKSIRVKSSSNRHHSTEIVYQGEQNDQTKFLRTSIHCMNPNRKSINHKSYTLESTSRYKYRRLEHLKWQKTKENSLSKRIQQFRKAKKQQIQKYTEIKNTKQVQERFYREKVRQEILTQRIEKQKAYTNVQKEKAFVALSQRVAFHQLKSQRKQIQDFQIYEKRLLYKKQKQIQLNKKKTSNRRKLQAKVKLDNKWISQFQLDGAQIQKKRNFAKKIQQAVNSFSKSSLIFL